MDPRRIGRGEPRALSQPVRAGPPHADRAAPQHPPARSALNAPSTSHQDAGWCALDRRRSAERGCMERLPTVRHADSKSVILVRARGFDSSSLRWKVGRVAYGTALLMRRDKTCVGSNPTPSAILRPSAVASCPFKTAGAGSTPVRITLHFTGTRERCAVR